MYAIYKYDFHQAPQRSILAATDGVDGATYLKKAQECFNALFDNNAIDNLSKESKKNEFTRLPNDVMAKKDGIIVWRVNNSQTKDWWARNGKDNKGIDKYEKQELESNPYCMVLIDNRPNHCIMAIEKSAAWSGTPNKLRDILLHCLNVELADRFDLEMRIEARMNPSEVWDFVYDRIYNHHDYIKNIAFEFLNPDKVNRTNDTEVKSKSLKSMRKTLKISKALKGIFTMEFDQHSQESISQKNRDLAEMVRLCGENGYNIKITFKDYKVYRINEYVKAYYPMNPKVLDGFRDGAPSLNGKFDIEEWFDEVEKQTKEYKNESEVSKGRNKKSA